MWINFITLILLPTLAFSWEEDPRISKLFNDAHIKGTFVLYDLSADKIIGFNQTRAKTRYIPASTFKIVNSLIGLSTGVVNNVDEVLPYKGPSKPFIAAWAHDMGLRKAIAISNVPIYQELARRIGKTRMQKGVTNLHYGNETIGNSIDTFWLDGPLKISALEQTKFLTKLVQNKLPLSKDIQKNVQEIILLEQEKEWKLYGKTGWQNAPNKGIGWFVGWLEKKGNIYVFALNIDIKQSSDATQRTKLTKASLQLMGLL
jgi:beta-lactamase class D